MTKRWTTFLAGWATVTLFLCFPLVTRAQDQPPDEAPKPAARAYPPLDTTGDETPAPDTLLPDMQPLTGVQNPTLGRVESPHSYWVPGVQYSNTIQSNYPGAGNSGWTITNYVAANVNLLESWRASQLAVNYSGGGDFSTDKTLGNGFFQELGASQSFQWARWQLAFFDQFSYLPQSEFGFGGGTGLGLPGGGITSGIPPSGVAGNLQSLFTAIGPQYDNNFVAQAVYQLSPRASVNVSGSYGILRFVDAGNIDSDSDGGSAGFNYQLTKEDTIGVVYHYSHLTYLDLPQAIGDNVINIVYGKKITGRLALRVFGGPDITTFSVPIGGVTRQVTGSGGADLAYALPRGSLSLDYNHGVTGGSGVLEGAETDEVSGGVSHRFTRVWSAQAHIGFARNRSIVNTAGQASYDSVYVGGGISRPLGPNAVFSLAYTANIQTTSAAAGNTSSTQHQITMNFQWHTRPLVLR